MLFKRAFGSSWTGIMWGFQGCFLISFLSSPVGVEGIGMVEPLRYVDILNNDNNVWWNEKEDSKIESVKDDDSDDVQELFLTQRLDHFSQSKNHSFPQRYFYSDRFVELSRKQQYALLCVGGEGPMMTKAVLVDSVHCSGDMLELASRLYTEQGASVFLFGLEHRYYGKSYPGKYRHDTRLLCW